MIANTCSLATHGMLAARARPAFATLRHNVAWFAEKRAPAPVNGTRDGFGTDLVWQFYDGAGWQLQPLGSFGAHNALRRRRHADERIRVLADQLLELGVWRRGFLAFEYLFPWGGGRPGSISGMAQATGTQAPPSASAIRRGGAHALRATLRRAGPTASRARSADVNGGCRPWRAGAITRIISRVPALPTILGELRRYFRVSGWVVHVPRGLEEKLLRVRNVEREMIATGGGPPGTAELASQLGWEVEELLEVLVAAHALAPASLDAPTHSDEELGSLGEWLGGSDPGYREWELRHELDEAMATLDVPVTEAVRFRFGEELSFSEIARRIGLSRAHASRLVDRALHQLGAVMQPGAT